MTLKKLLSILRYIEGAYASVGDVNMHGSLLGATAGSELCIYFSSQPPRSLHTYLKARGFIEWQGDYIYRQRKP
jgi:hypothetical protein